MDSTSRVPSVTQGDLTAFHQQIYGKPAPLNSLLEAQSSTNLDQTHGDEYEEEVNDDLGYYPDGKKRTLTDEQISIFRHSEVYNLIRQRQVRLENGKAEPLFPQPVKESDAEMASDDAHAKSGTTPTEPYFNQGKTSLQKVDLRKPRQKRRKLQHEQPTQPPTQDYPSRREIREFDNAAVAPEEELDY
ncbi:uncharacterized protein KY384_008559 [Bacidia gigantensis]|uniref:uncharacterized protein n=1 Tax=Bacidia gigantensis TaxID=2732470 RepID=UPI001D053E5E|nr:uncharacterized protein KY384_008559 [Bacidia gigantensis]KAG8527130.1 hypothetical protein KY384_008559 [Bacidia gigantensis]